MPSVCDQKITLIGTLINVVFPPLYHFCRIFSSLYLPHSHGSRRGRGALKFSCLERRWSLRGERERKRERERERERKRRRGWKRIVWDAMPRANKTGKLHEKQAVASRCTRSWFPAILQPLLLSQRRMRKWQIRGYKKRGMEGVATNAPSPTWKSPLPPRFHSFSSSSFSSVIPLFSLIILKNFM